MGNLTEKELLKLNMIKKILSNECSKIIASQELGISIRQINRLIEKYHKEGEKGFIHKNRGKESEKKIAKEIKDEIVNLYLTEYYDYNFTHFHEEIVEKYAIAYKTVEKILTETNIISPEAHHKTVRNYNANMKKLMRKKTANKKEIELYKKRQEAEKQKHVRRSSLLYNFGQEVQMDATFAMWYGNKVMALHLAVDRATKKVLYGYFDVQETTKAYCIMLMNILLSYGIPKKIKTDKRGTFSLNNIKINSNLNATQFGRICRELGIQLSSSSDPLFKPNVERENKTVKGRLISELRHENIINDKEANDYLNNVFIPKINALFSYEIDDDKNEMKENTYTFEELNIIISEQYTRKIDNASSLKYGSKYYIPIDIETGEILSYSRNTICTVIIAYDNTFFAKIEDKICILHNIKAPEKKKPTRSSKTIEEINRSKAHKPAPNHPWRNYRKN